MNKIVIETLLFKILVKEPMYIVLFIEFNVMFLIYDNFDGNFTFSTL